jgi:hypothetical protein
MSKIILNSDESFDGYEEGNVTGGGTGIQKR